MAIILQTKAQEGNTSIFRCILKDPDNVPISVSTITSAKLTLRDQETGEIINHRDDVDILSFIDTSGHFSFTFDPADNVITSTDPLISYETHVISLDIDYTINGKSHTLAQEVWVDVENLQFI